MMPNLMMLHISRVGTYWWWKHPIVSRFPTLDLIIGGGLYGYIFSPQVFRKKNSSPFQARHGRALQFLTPQLRADKEAEQWLTD